MEPTVFGALVTVAGLFLLRKPVEWTFVLMIVCTEFGAASALNLPMLGGSSIQPDNLALGFVLLRLLISARNRFSDWLFVVEDNLWLVCFCLYTAVTAYILPRLFQGQMLVVPLRNTSSAGAWTPPSPLRFTPQNITTSVYLIGTVMVALAGSLIARTRTHAAMTLVGALLAVGWLHVAFGLIDLGLAAIGHQNLLDVFRNGNYAQVNQGVSGFRRISGVFTETSSYSHYGLVFFVFASELWLRAILVRWSGALSLALLVMLLMTTSSTAYLGLALYAAVFAFRLIFIPGGTRPSAVLGAGAVSIAAVVAVVGVAALHPAMAAKIGAVIQDMTFNKAASLSAKERAQWAAQGLHAFSLSRGLGVGAGSFRSSSFLTAILGSSGVIGLAAMTFYLLQLLKPLRPSTYRASVDGLAGAGAAAGWAAAIGLGPLMFIGASPDPGLLFGLFAGLSMGWRSLRPAPSVGRPAPDWRQATALEGA